MSETKWTAGPWQFCKASRQGYLVTSDASPWVIVGAEDAEGRYGVIDEEANARLIAAAPELYEALKAMVGDCKFSFIEGVEHWHVKQMPSDAALDAARAALAKARGE